MSEALEYEIVVRSRNGQSIAWIRELGLACRGANAAAAIEQLERRKTEYLDSMRSFGLEHEIPRPHRASQSFRMRRDLELFACKLAIAGVVGALSAGLTGALLINKLGTISAGSLLRRQAQSVQDAIEGFNRAPNDVKKRRVEEMRSAIHDLQPALEELRLVLQDQAQGRASKR